MSRKLNILFSTEFSGLNTGYACIAKNLLSAFHNSGKYNIFEHARYCKGSDPYHRKLIQATPWTVIPNMPETEQEEQLYRSHPANEFGRWKWDYVCCEVQPEIVCFAAGTPVTTIAGAKNIEDIQLGDRVLTHQGRYEKVVRLFKTPNKDSLLQLSIRCNNHKLKVTKNHPFLTVGKDTKAEPRWVDASELSRGDLLCLPIQQKNNDFVCSADVARLIGYYAAEGCLMYKKTKDQGRLSGVQFTFNKKEQGYIEDIINTVIQNFKYKIITSKNVKNCCVLRIFSDELIEFINTVITGISTTKSFSEKILLAPREIQREVLCGLFRGDGGYSNNRHYYYTSSRNLAYQVYNMCLRFGIIPAMGYNKNTLNGETFYRHVFSFGGTSAFNFVKLLDRTFDFDAHERINDKYAFVNLKEVEEVEPEEFVYNIEVENDNSYVAVTCCHNCSYDDFWMSSFIDQSPFRKFYKTVMMPTVDSKNQNTEWLDLYIRTDHVLTYTDFAYKVLEEEGGGLIPLRGTATPSIDTKVYKFSGNRREHKQKFGLDPDSIIIGMVARNQRRKMFPDLGQAFAEFLSGESFKDTKNVFLYWHTSHPDVGWDIPKYIKDLGLSHKLLMTYYCHNCRRWFPDFYRDAVTICKYCHQKSAPLSNSQFGIDTEGLACIYNFMDLYVQFVTNEGLGIPCLEAAACGCPFAATNYSGTEDLIRKLQGKAISPRTMFCEAETSRDLCFPSINELTKYIKEFVVLPESIRHRMSVRTSNLAHQYYGGWDKVAEKWMSIFDSIGVTQENKWLSPIDIIHPQNIQMPDNLSNEQFIMWCLGDVLHRPDWINSYIGLKMLRDLTWGRTTKNTLGFFFGELSQLSMKPEYDQCDRNSILKLIVDMRSHYNNSEQLRLNYINSGRIK